MTTGEQVTRLLTAIDLLQQKLIVNPDLAQLEMWHFLVMLNMEKKIQEN